MKTIGLVTYYNSDNYGAMLQAYALQKEIIKNGCRCEIISHNRFSSTNNEISGLHSGSMVKLYKILIKFIRYPRSAIFFTSSFSKNIINGKKRQKIKCALFRENYFPQKSREFFYSTDQIMRNPPLYDAYVCGSDQIWNPERFEGSEPFFLAFAPKGRNRIAYAPSLAMTSIPMDMHQKYTEFLSCFSDISVREEKGCRAVEEATGIKPELVMDPTFLMTRDEWIDFGSVNINVPKKYIFCYFLGKENLLNARKSINLIADHYNAEVIVLPFGGHMIDKHWKGICDAGPKEFVALIKNACYVLTDSFHGTALSIILKKNFNVYAGKVNESFKNRFDRIANILKICSLEDRMFTSWNDLIPNKIDYKKTEDLLSPIIERSKKFLKNALDKVKIQNDDYNMQITHPHLASLESCTGCSACSAICPKGAITMRPDNAGFWRPSIDVTLCVKCGMCEDKCPIITINSRDVNIPDYYALYAFDESVRNKGSSGNAFGLLSQMIIKNEGVVFGAALSKDCRKLKMCSSIDVGIDKLQKSKYFEAEMGNVIKQIKTALASGKKVMFSGTPCQAAGVRMCFGNHPDLLVCDFICHGVPSADLFGSYLSEIEKDYNSKATDVQFRSKALGWRLYCMQITFENGKKYLKTRYSDPYYIDFFRNNHLRSSCYSCNRILKSYADITFGDYWASNVKKNIIDNDKGISVVAVRTEKGNSFFSSLERSGVAYVKHLSCDEVDETFISRIRKKPIDNDLLPKQFNMRPKLKLKEEIYRLYAEYVLKKIKYKK